ncbi:hypothetical protein [Edwardsiella phage IW-1]|uniref:Portal protein n=1 Tax=Edwardsiella phage IW-1 TaxID=1244857 RepID=K4PYC9_9CAUD|nr:hypothetical protein [Edwardsiella phage IW-1]
MKAIIEDLQDAFRVGYEVFEKSRKEADEVWNLFHNRHFSDRQLAVLENRGQPAETFNVIKMFARMLVGYYSTVVNTAVISPRHYRDIDAAAVLNDVVNYTFEDNRFDTIEGDKIKLSAMVSGLLVSFIDVVPTDETDEFGRPINRIVMSHVPDSEVVLDPMSRADDYSDAMYLHRFKWMSKERVIKLFGKAKMQELDAYFNHLNIKEADFDYLYGQRFVGKYKVMDNYLIVHSVIEDEDGKRWSCFWCQDVMLEKEEITYKEVRWPYRVERVQSSDKAEYYGIFHEVIQSQHAINQAVLKIQLMVNSNKAFVEEKAVDNMADFETAYNRVTGIIPVLNLNGIKISTMAGDVQQQYLIVDNALARIQKVLGINDSFLGMAFASDSGRKVKLQQNATIMSLRYITARIESFYELLAYDVAKLAQQYYSAHQVIQLTDEIVGERWIEVNKPMQEFTGRIDPMTGEPETQAILLPETDPANGEFLEDDAGNIIFGPVKEEGTDFSFTKFQVRIDSSAYNDDDEKGQLLLETVMSGAIGQMVMQANPAGFFKMASLSVKTMKTRYAPNISEVLEQTAQMLQGNQQQNAALAQANMGVQQGFAGQPQSESLKLPEGEY